MKSFAVFSLALCVTVALALPQSSPAGNAQGTGTYTKKYDNIDVDAILDNPKLVKSYVGCLTTGRQCTPEGTELRRVLPDALATSCVRCSDKQKESAWKVITKVQKDYPQEWKILSAKWDPTGDYFKKLQEAIKNGSVPQIKG